ncbi:F-box/kelch-repeat protein At2g22050-like [Brassica rapa]|uniref:F-box/kelch-repeat protein At2g22050-like n=1 Tax=Brassica campestris TaxID=3711 RepID=UPI00142D5233|nr:F-box/kelch-repeat protein At2g22050-like [Brassica rapa]
MQDPTFSVSPVQTMSNFIADDEPPKKHTTHPPPPHSLSSLPADIVLRCLVRVPKCHHLNISWVSKDLRFLVRSPELKVLRSTLPKSSLHLCFQKDDDHHSSFHWFTLSETSTTTTEYGLVPNPTPFPPHKYGSSTVTVGSKIFFIGGGSSEPSSDLWILDTRSGNMTKGPSMSVPREKGEAAVGVIDGKIYVIGGGGSFQEERFNEEIQVEAFDVKSETWELAGMENVRKTSRCSASVEGKVYMVEYGEINVYNPRECERERMVRMVSQRLERGRKDMLNDSAFIVCVVEDVLYAFFYQSGIMWFNTKLNVWRRLLDRDGKELPFIFHVDAMAEYDDGKLVILYMLSEKEIYHTVTKSIRCMLVSLHRSGDMICGTVDWSGSMGTVPDSVDFLHCLAVSD